MKLTQYVCLVLGQGDMELALESYDVCTGLLQSKPKSPEQKNYTINLPNLRVDAAISVEEVGVTFNSNVYNYVKYIINRNVLQGVKIKMCNMLTSEIIQYTTQII